MEKQTIRIRGVVADGNPRGARERIAVNPLGVELGAVKMWHRRPFESAEVVGVGELSLVDQDGKAVVEATIDLVLHDIEVPQFRSDVEAGLMGFGVHECRVSYVDLQRAVDGITPFRIIEVE